MIEELMKTLKELGPVPRRIEYLLINPNDKDKVPTAICEALGIKVKAVGGVEEGKALIMYAPDFPSNFISPLIGGRP